MGTLLSISINLLLIPLHPIYPQCLYWTQFIPAFAKSDKLLAYLWTGSINGIKLQIWATWLMYAVLVDLSDAVAQAVQLPLERISMEMVWRGLYHFNDAYHKGKVDDPVAYLAAPENRDLGVIKAQRKPPKEIDFRPFFNST